MQLVSTSRRTAKHRHRGTDNNSLTRARATKRKLILDHIGCRNFSSFVVQLSLLLFVSMMLVHNKAATSKTQRSLQAELEAAASNHSAHFVDQDNQDYSGSKSVVASENNRAQDGAPVHYDDQDHQDAEDSDEEEEDDLPDEEEFYQQNPVGSLHFSLKDIEEPNENETVFERSNFDDFDDFDALQLNEFFGSPEQTSSHKEEPSYRPSASNKNRSKQWPSNRKTEPRWRKSWPLRKLSTSGESWNQRDDGSKQTAASEPSETGQSSVSAGCAMPLASGPGCLTYAMVEWALARARRQLGGRELQAAASGGSATRPPSERSIHSVAELVELTSRLLAMRYRLSPEEVTLGLEQIDVRRLSLWRQCPRFFRAAALNVAANCELRSATAAGLASRFRSHSGRCNNPLGAYLGASHLPFVRLLEPEYWDSVGVPRMIGASSAAPLPAARLVSLALHDAREPADARPSGDLSALFANWGQLINHDLALAAGAGVQSGHSGSCCEHQQSASLAADFRRMLGLSPGSTRLGRICWPIQLDARDPIYGPAGWRCHEFKRSIGALRPGCSLGARSQVNLVTSYVDASFVYGSSAHQSRQLRSTSSRGQLATWNYFRAERLLPLLPPWPGAPESECVGRRPEGLSCFRSGDARTNQHLPLVVLHTLHTRQHNRLARALGQLNPHWTADRVYHEARHLHIALVQHILISEYLPLLLGPQTISEFNLTEAPAGEYWDHYEPELNPGVAVEFAAAAFRQGHSSVPSLVFRLGANGRRRVYPLRQLFRQPWPLFEPWALDEFLAGLLETPAQQVDQFVSRELAGHLLQEPSERLGLDLVAINVQRGRDQGVANYNALRQWCGLGAFETFEQLASVMSNQTAQVLGQLYGSVDDIDLFTGGLSEWPLEGGQLGPTFACIVGHQFRTLRAGDRFWFESSHGAHAFTPEQLQSIKQTTLSRLICANSDRFERAPADTIQLLALRLPHPVLNPRVPCQSLPDVDLAAWLEVPPAAVAQEEEEDEGDNNEDEER